ncbi:MAG TPA: L,D-transpeptidase family protein [Solirubrobacteraceae bacterium]|nr:L,D-transpeptidase family protein [Solirubrobacteraceae bacterium]
MRALPRHAAALAAVLAPFTVAGAAGMTSATATATAPPVAASPSSPAPPAKPQPESPTRIVTLPRTDVSNGAAQLRVTLSAPPARESPRPTFFPAVAGRWSTSGDGEVFTPSSTLSPCSTYKFTVWADTIATGHTRVGSKHVLTLHVACPPLAGAQEILARLGYLGARLRPRYRVHLHSGPESLRLAAAQAYGPYRGSLLPDPGDAPPVTLGTLDATTRGALEVFQEDHRLAVTGEPDAATWHLLLEVAAMDHRDPRPYTWVSVTESLPETLEVHEGDRVAVSTPANTGVAGAETERGIFPIYSRLVSTTMTGTDPDGEHYVAPDVPWVNYFNGGDAVHGYPRASYGFPQSNGCVELPIGTAERIYPMLAIGDIVWVQ